LFYWFYYGDKHDMAITTGSIIEVSLKQLFSGQQMYNVYHYGVVEIIGTVNASNYAAAWWNHVKTNYRGLAQSIYGQVFDSVRVVEMGASDGEFAEFAIPTGERTGTRPTTAEPQSLPTFNAVGVRLTVGTRETRPGQKRITFMSEADTVGNSVEAGFLGGVQSLAALLSVPIVLGSPAAGCVLQPCVVRKGPAYSVLASQAITGYLVNPYVTSQVSRKQGRGV
jgi:hypothetical protein